MTIRGAPGMARCDVYRPNARTFIPTRPRRARKQARGCQTPNGATPANGPSEARQEWRAATSIARTPAPSPPPVRGARVSKRGDAKPRMAPRLHPHPSEARALASAGMPLPEWRHASQRTIRGAPGMARCDVYRPNARTPPNPSHRRTSNFAPRRWPPYPCASSASSSVSNTYTTRSPLSHLSPVSRTPAAGASPGS